MTPDELLLGHAAALLDPYSDRPLHEQIAALVEAEIVSGQLRQGQRLPPQRHLARQFGVAIGTLTRAFEMLIARGLVRAEVGRGSFVARRALVPTAAPGFVDPSRNVPPPTISADMLKRLSVVAIDRLYDEGGNVCNDPAGSLRHRRAYAGWLDRLGLTVEPSQMLLTTNAQHAIDLAFSLSARTKPGETALCTASQASKAKL